MRVKSFDLKTLRNSERRTKQEMLQYRCYPFSRWESAYLGQAKIIIYLKNIIYNIVFIGYFDRRFHLHFKTAPLDFD